MPKISYQEIVTADVSESGTVTHEWEYNERLLILTHTINKSFEAKYLDLKARDKWNELCRSKK